MHASAGLELQDLLQSQDVGVSVTSSPERLHSPRPAGSQADTKLAARMDRQKLFEAWKQSLRQHAVPDAPVIEVLQYGTSLSATDRKFKLRNGRSREYLVQGLDLYDQVRAAPSSLIASREEDES